MNPANVFYLLANMCNRVWQQKIWDSTRLMTWGKKQKKGEIPQNHCNALVKDKDTFKICFKTNSQIMVVLQ